jgi:hypothetical protein
MVDTVEQFVLQLVSDLISTGYAAEERIHARNIRIGFLESAWVTRTIGWEVCRPVAAKKGVVGFQLNAEDTILPVEPAVFETLVSSST